MNFVHVWLMVFAVSVWGLVYSGMIYFDDMTEYHSFVLGEMPPEFIMSGWFMILILSIIMLNRNLKRQPH